MYVIIYICRVCRGCAAERRTVVSRSQKDMHTCLRTVLVFPACAGVSRNRQYEDAVKRDIPRVRGGEPDLATTHPDLAA